MPYASFISVMAMIQVKNTVHNTTGIIKRWEEGPVSLDPCSSERSGMQQP